MVIKEREPKSGDAKGEGQGAPLPYLGRSVRVVGQWDSVDAAQTPHEKNKRGELGKTLFNYYFNRTSPDPLGRTSTNNYGADRRNVLASVVGRGTRGGEVNADRVDVADPAAMTRHIKTVAKFLGASDVGIAQLHPSMLYAGGRGADDGTGGTEDGQAPGEPTSETVKKYPYAIACVGAWDYELGKAHRHRIGDFTYHESGDRLQITFANLMQYIKDLGYSAVRGPAQAMPVALAAGLGEVGRNGMLITKSYGARVHLGTPILTDLPLVSDKPLDIGVEDFCRICKKCATTCPTNSISVGGKAVINGIEKYKINWETCYRLRAHVKQFWGICLTCVTVCPYTKPKTWWHGLAVNTLQRTPIPIRPLTVRPLKWLDDVFWGKVPRKRVQFMSYDSGYLKLPKVGNGAEQELKTDGKTGYYYPLKENTRRFDILKEKQRARK
jgi:ferredoxin